MPWTFNECVGVTKTSGQPVSYIELKNGNILSAVYIYLGCSELSGELLGPSYEEMPFKGTYWWNQDTQIPLLHYSSVQDEIEKLKQSFVASIKSIGGGLKITDGVLSIDCASVSDTENAVNEIIK